MSFRAVVAVVGVVAGWAVAARADDADIKKAAKAEAGRMQAALAKGDYVTLAGLTHPRVVAGMGGKKKMIEQVTAGVKEMKAQGFAFEAVTVGDPTDPVRSGADLYLTLPLKITMTAPGGRLKSAGTLVGLSSDGGKTWAFVDAAPGRDKVRKALPDLPDAVVLPDNKPPVFEKNKG